MQELTKNINPIPVKTWRWLGLNDTRLEAAVPLIVPYRKHVLRTKLSGGVTATQEQEARKAWQAMEATIDAGVSGPMAEFVSLKRNSSYFIEIPAGKKVLAPIILHYELDDENPTVIDDHLIVAQENSEATIVICYTGVTKGFHSGITKVYAKAGASVHVVKVQLLGDEAVQIDATGAVTEEAAKVDFTLVELGAAHSITSNKTKLNGKNSQSKINSIYFGDKQRKIDINYVLTHQAPAVLGEIITRGALLGESQKIFRGTLDFVTGACGAKGKEEEYTVLLSPKVRNRSIPLMLCNEADVEGQHAASTGQMDEEQLFYLMSRGISEVEAKKLIIEASFQPIVDKIPVVAIKEAISEYIRRRLAHVG